MTGCWLQELAAEGGWIVISIDQFKKSKAERELLRQHGLTVFVLDPQWAKQPYWEKAGARLVLWWPNILNVAKLTSKTAMRIPCALFSKSTFEQIRGLALLLVRHHQEALEGGFSSSTPGSWTGQLPDPIDELDPQLDADKVFSVPFAQGWPPESVRVDRYRKNAPRFKVPALSGASGWKTTNVQPPESRARKVAREIDVPEAAIDHRVV